MKMDSLQSIAASLASADSTDGVLKNIVEGICRESDAALARIWLKNDGDRCETCQARKFCTDQTRCLHLVASDGMSLDLVEGRWRNLNGRFCRMPMNSPKIGSVASTGEPTLVSDMDPRWIVDQDWMTSEKIKCYAGQPLIFRGEILGVMGVFSRSMIDDDSFAILRTFANQAAAAIANARAFDEISRLKNELESENELLRREVIGDLKEDEIIGASPAIEQVRWQIEALAQSDATVLIQGESGTGKELVARAIHASGPMAKRPMIRVNCAAIPRELFESEFFGHVKGAFTGAAQDRVGRFELADGGTLFLDEVGEIPLELQSKLLRVLQEGTLERVGDAKSIEVNVRVVAATNRDLGQAVKEQRFREDLFYRLNVFPITVPPLRVRQDDIGVLATHFLQAGARRLGRDAPILDDEQVAQLEGYAWPGNIRELQNVIERSLITAKRGKLRFDVANTGNSWSKPVPGSAPSASFYTYADLSELERQSITDALEISGGKVGGRQGAAELLGIKSTTLAYRMKKLGIRQSKVIESAN